MVREIKKCRNVFIYVSPKLSWAVEVSKNTIVIQLGQNKRTIQTIGKINRTREVTHFGNI